MRNEKEPSQAAVGESDRDHQPGATPVYPICIHHDENEVEEEEGESASVGQQDRLEIGNDCRSASLDTRSNNVEQHLVEASLVEEPKLVEASLVPYPDVAEEERRAFRTRIARVAFLIAALILCVIVGIVVWLTANGGRTGSDPKSDEAATAQPTSSPSNEPSSTKLLWPPKASQRLSWQCQLDGVLDTSLNVDVYLIDIMEDTKIIDELHRRDVKVVCTFSAGHYEGWREDWGKYFGFIEGEWYDGTEPPFAGDVYDWEERWLDIRRLDLLEPIMTGRLETAVSLGCDGVAPDNLDAYWAEVEETRLFNLTSQDQLEYNRWIASKAHELGMPVALMNNVGQLGDHAEYYDFAINEQCFEYNECAEYRVFLDQDKAVFGMEYNGDPAVFCPLANSQRLSWIMKTEDHDEWRIGCEDYD